MTDWQLIETAPKDGREIRIAWLCAGCVEYEKVTRWYAGQWLGGWTPTHWKRERRKSPNLALPLGLKKYFGQPND